MGMPSKGGSSAPTPPDPKVTAEAQTGSNVNTAIANAVLGNVNQRTPTGSLTYNQIGTQTVDGREVPRYEAITTLSPEQQRLYESGLGVSQGTADLANRYVGRIADATAQPFSYEGAPDAPVYDEGFRQQARDSIIARNQPNMDRDLDMLRTTLANQGIGVGSEAFTNAMSDYSRGVNDFRLGADIQSGSEAERAFGLGAQTRDRWIAEQANLRNQPINEVAALLGTGAGVQGPQFLPMSPPQIPGTDIAGIYANDYQNRLLQYQIDQGGRNAGMGGIFGLLGAGLGGWARGGFGGLGGMGGLGGGQGGSFG